MGSRLMMPGQDQALEAARPFPLQDDMLGCSLAYYQVGLAPPICCLVPLKGCPEALPRSLQNRFLRKKGVPIDLIERVKTAMDAAQPPSPVALTKPTRTRLASGRVTSQLGRSI